MLGTLFIAAVITFIVWLIQFHWKRRELYELASKINGPTALPLLGNSLYFVPSNFDMISDAFQLTRDYQSPVRIWLGQKLCFMVWKPSQLEIILNDPNAMEKAEIYKLTEALLGKGLFNANVEEWRRIKKIVMPTFNQKILNDFVEVFAKQSEILVQQLKQLVGKGTFDAFKPIGSCTLDMFCETALGVCTKAQTTDCEYMHWIHRITEIGTEKLWKIWYHYDFISNRTALAKEAYALIDKAHDFSRTIVAKKRLEFRNSRANKEVIYEDEEVNKKKILLDQLIEIAEESENFTDNELRQELDSFIIAGSHSSAITDSFTFVMLGMHPEIQEKVYNEVMEVIGPTKPVEWTDLNKLVYLERVLKETMRLFPIGPLLGRSAKANVKLDNCTLPAGSTLGIFILGVQRDPEIWTDPLKFDPDRFLPEEVAKRHPYSWLPFSGGPRNCVGIKYGMMAMKVLIATVIRKVKLSTECRTVEDIKLKLDFLLQPVDGYKVSVELRN